MSMRRFAALAAIPLAGLGLSCGDDGNGCTGTQCQLMGMTVVKWTFNNHPELLFPDDSCNEVGSAQVHVVATHTEDPTLTAELTATCNDKQVSFAGLEPGTYNVLVTPLDDTGASLVGMAAGGTVPAGSPGANTEVTVNVPYTAWSRAYTGNFLFQFRWGGQPCAMATPPVVTQQLTLTVRGMPVTKLTSAGQAVNGTDMKPCATMFDFISDLPFGPAMFAVVGKDAGGVVRFEKTYDTFVGVGVFNPTITYDLPLPDAGVDAPPDAPPDAPVDAPPDTM